MYGWVRLARLVERLDRAHVLGWGVVGTLNEGWDGMGDGEVVH